MPHYLRIHLHLSLSSYQGWTPSNSLPLLLLIYIYFRMFSQSLNYCTLRPRLDETRVSALEELKSLVHVKLQSLLVAQNSACCVINLPVEIIVDIFRFACFSDVPENYSDEDMYYDLFMRLTRSSIATTCSYWRKVIVQDPLVWRSIHLPCTSLPRRSRPPIFNSIGTEIERCGEKTIFLDLETEQSELPLVATLLETNVNRIEELVIFSRHNIRIADLRIFDGDFELPKLKVLQLDSGAESSSQELNDSDINLSRGSLLHRLRLENSCTFTPHRFDTTWTVTPPSSCIIEHVFVWGFFRARDVVELLNSCTALRSLVWHITDHTEELHNLENLGTMPNLLNLRFGGSASLEYLTNIHAPSLRHLHLSPDTVMSLPNEHIPAVIFPNLISLIINHMHENPNIQTFLENHCWLKVLELIDVTIGPELISYLSSTTLPGCLVKLETLTIKFENDDPQHLAETLPHILEELLIRPATDTPFRLRYRSSDSKSSQAVDWTKIDKLLASFPETFCVVSDDVESEWERL